ncbi:MAG TPA: lysylphosphatidylglycerol synthase transmembrane domain-containing protein [Steroidobacteraceae bacterium]|nr:lysylphosphatidylglycerol synthase transmembrane domain-containing protein [Steroidobacteraceae bacterium]
MTVSRTAGRGLRLAVSLGLLALVLWLAHWQSVIGVLEQVSGRWVFAAVCFSAADRLLCNYRWQILLAARGVPIGFLRLFGVQLAANFFGSFLPGSVGIDAIRIAALCRAGEPTAPVVAATLVDRVSKGIATFLFGSLAILTLAGEQIPHDVQRVVLYSTLAIVITTLAAFHPAVQRRVRLALLPRLPERWGSAVSAVADASLAFRRERGTLVAVTVLTAVFFAMRILCIKALTLACGVEIPIASLVLIIPIIWIVLMLPVTIGNIGLQDAGYVALMGLIGVGAPIAVSVSLLEHVITRLVCLPGAFLFDTLALRKRQTVE